MYGYGAMGAGAVAGPGQVGSFGGNAVAGGYGYGGACVGAGIIAIAILILIALGVIF